LSVNVAVTYVAEVTVVGHVPGPAATKKKRPPPLQPEKVEPLLATP